MTLEVLQNDIIDAANHEELDKMVWLYIGRDVYPGGAASCLTAVVQGWSYLNQEYDTARATNELLDSEPGLRDMVLDAWKGSGFKAIRSLKILNPKPSGLTAEYTQAAVDAFKTKYKGSSATLLASVIDDTYHADPELTYVRALSIIQSSGMGKSRTIDEMAKTRITIPICLREDNAVGFAYPLVDKQVRKYFTQAIGEQVQESQFRAIVLRFLEALFAESSRIIQEIPGSKTYLDVATHLRNFFWNPGKRDHFFDSVVDTAYMYSSNKPETSTEEMRVRNAFRKLMASVPKVPNAMCPFIISIDEAHTLFSNVTATKTRYDVFCSVLGSLKGLEFFVVFSSTASRRSELTPTKAVSPSYRPKEPSIVLPAPFTELGFDDFAVGAVVEDQLGLDCASKFSFLVKFGRPLWASFWNSLLKTGISEAEARSVVLQLARDKLCGQTGPVTEVLKGNAALAALSVRLLLDADPAREAARITEEELVASHMRIAFSVPGHREFMRTGTPTEPVLAEAAARLMNTVIGNRPAIDVLGTLEAFFSDGFSPTGERGEFMGRLLDILAVDSAIKAMGPGSIPQSPQPPQPPNHNYNIPVKVTGYLKHLLGESNFRRIKDIKPSNSSQISSKSCDITLERAFANAYIHVTHYVRAEDSSVLQAKWLWAYWARGAAFHLKPSQRDSNRALPVYWPSFQEEIIVTGEPSKHSSTSPPRKKPKTHSAEGDWPLEGLAGDRQEETEVSRDVDQGMDVNPDVSVSAGNENKDMRGEDVGTGIEPNKDTSQDSQQENLKLGRHTCSVILHQDKNAAYDNRGAPPFQMPEDKMFDGVLPKPVLAITHIYDYPEPGIRFDSSSQASHAEPAVPGAPIYEITICGLHEDNYRPISVDNRSAFKALLGRDDIYEEHTRQNKLAINALHQLKPGVSEHPASTGWTGRGQD